MSIGTNLLAHNNALGTSLGTSVTTAGASEIHVFLTSNATSITSVVGSTLGAFTRRVTNGLAASLIEEWVFKSTGAVTGETITVTNSNSAFLTVDICETTGNDTTTIFDTNGAIPASTSTLGGTVAATTSNANDIIYAAYRMSATASPTEGSGWTKHSGANFQLLEYQIVSATQSGLTATIGTGNGGQNGGVLDAVMAAGGVTVRGGNMLMMGV